MQLTLDIYSHLVPDLKLKERAAARLDALLTEPDQNSGQNAANVVSRIGIEPFQRPFLSS